MSNRKIHLIRNVNPEVHGIVPACASNAYAPKAHRNGRVTRQFMASEVVAWDQFKTMNSKELCMQCLDACLIIRNRQRKAKGLAAITKWDEGCEKAPA